MRQHHILLHKRLLTDGTTKLALLLLLLYVLHVNILVTTDLQIVFQRNVIDDVCLLVKHDMVKWTAQHWRIFVVVCLVIRTFAIALILLVLSFNVELDSLLILLDELRRFKHLP